MKGQGTIIVMFSVLITVYLTGFLAFNALNNADKIAQNNIDDLSVFAQAETRAENYAENYLPLAAEYSVNQVVKNSKDIKYTKSDVENGVKIKDSIIDNIRANTKTFLRKNYQVGVKQGCSFSYPGYSLSLENNGENASVEVKSGGNSLVSVTCRQKDVEVSYSTDKSSVYTEVEGNPVFQFAEETNETMYRLEDKGETLTSSGTKSSSATKCNWTQKSNAKNFANKKAETAAENALDSIEGSMKLDLNDDRFTRDLTLLEDKNVRSTSEKSGSTAKECGCRGPRARSGGNTKCQKLYKGSGAKYNYNYDTIFLKYSIEDTKYKVPVDSGMKYLKMTSIYKHDFP